MQYSRNHDSKFRGHLSLHAFTHVVSDPRLKNIPLILETPTFESPSVWRTEISVLNRLAGQHLKGPCLSQPDVQSDVELNETVELVEEIRQAVWDAAASSKKDTTKGKGVKASKRGKKNKDEDDVDNDSDLTPLSD